jgi:hypothetical protein
MASEFPDDGTPGVLKMWEGDYLSIVFNISALKAC